MKRLLSDKIYQDLLKITTLTLVVRIVGLLLGFVFASMVSKLYGAAYYGQYTVLLAWCVPLATAANFGTDKLLLKEVSRNQENGFERLYGMALLLTAVISLLIAIGLLLAEQVSAFDLLPKRVFLLLLCAFPTYAYLMLNSYMLKANGRQTYSVFLEAVLPVLIALIILFIVSHWFARLNLVLESYTIGLGVSALVAYAAVGKSRGKCFSFNISKFRYFRLIKNAYPFFTTSIITSLLVSVDVVILAWIVDAKEIAVYAIAVRLVALIAFPLNGVMHAISPKYSSNFASRNIAMVAELHSKATKFSILISLPYISLMVFFPSLLLDFFGNEYYVGTPLIYILLVGQLVNLIVGPIGYLMWMCDMAEVLKKIMLVVLIVNIALNFLLIPILGITGAAIASALCLCIKNTWSLWVVRQRLGFWGVYSPVMLKRPC